jgi:ankyrin repeat protein/beta-lactamase regulating signal transducer with metallopeptidase domain
VSGWLNLFSEPWVERLGWVLIHFLWQGAGIALLLAVALRLLTRASSHLRYVAIGSALLLCAVMPVVTWILLSPQAELSVSTAPVSNPTELSQMEAPAGLGPGFHRDAAIDLPGNIQTRWQDDLRRMADAALPDVVGLWFGGVLILTLRLTLVWTLMRRLCRSGSPIHDSRCLERFRNLLERMQVGVPVRLLQSALVEVPTLIGWLRPTILVPVSIFTGLTPEQLEAILAHELAHVRRYDYLANLLQTVVETILFYHPAVWWISRKLREERENCCDDMALEVMQDRLVYVSALAQLEEGRGLPFVLTASGGSLLQRIRRIAGAKDGKTSAWPLWILLIGILSVMCLTQGKNENPTDLGQLQSLCKKAAENGNVTEFIRLSEKIKSMPGQSGWQVGDGVILDAVARGDRPVVQAIIDQGWDRNKYSVMRLGGAAAKSPGMRDWLVAKGVKVPEYNNGEALIDAAAREDIPEMDRLVKTGVDINYRGESEWTPITKAAVSNKVESVRFLLAHGADPNSVKSPGWNYSGLCLTGSPAVADLLLAAGADLNAKVYSDHAHIIDYCISNGPVKMVKWFIAHGVDPAKVKSERQTFLFNVANPEIAEILIKAGIDVNARDRQGETALMQICGYSHDPAPIAQVLLEHGVDPNAHDNGGTTALLWARDGATVDLLIAHGADLTAKDKLGNGVLQTTLITAEASRLEALIRHGVPFDPKTDGPRLLCGAAREGQIDIVAFLLDRGVDPNAIFKTIDTEVRLPSGEMKHVQIYDTPLQEAVGGNQYAVAKLLLDRGAKILGWKPGGVTSLDELSYAVNNREDNIALLLWDHGARGVSPLSFAISQGQSTAQIAALLDQGASPNPSDGLSDTPLTLAAKNGRLDLVHLLLQRGANLNPAGKKQTSPLTAAIETGQDEVVDYLLQHGAQANFVAVVYAEAQSVPYRAGGRSRDHYEQSVKLLVQHGALEKVTPVEAGEVLTAALGDYLGPGSPSVVKTVLDAGLSPQAPAPLSVLNGKPATSVMAYYRDQYEKAKSNSDHVFIVEQMKTLLDLLEAADKGASTDATDTNKPTKVSPERPGSAALPVKGDADQGQSAADKRFDELFNNLSIENLEVHDMPLDQFVEKISRELAAEDPQKQGISFVLNIPPGEPPISVSLDFSKIPGYRPNISMILGPLKTRYPIRYHYKADGTIIYIEQLPRDEIAFDQKAASTRIDIDFSQADPVMALKMVQAASAGKGFAFDLDLKAIGEIDAIKKLSGIDLKATQVSVDQALRSIFYLADLHPMPLDHFTGYAIQPQSPEATKALTYIVVGGQVVSFKAGIGAEKQFRENLQRPSPWWGPSVQGPAYHADGTQAGGFDMSHKVPGPSGELEESFKIDTKIIDKAHIQIVANIEIKDSHGVSVGKASCNATLVSGTRALLTSFGHAAISIPTKGTGPPWGAWGVLQITLINEDDQPLLPPPSPAFEEIPVTLTSADLPVSAPTDAGVVKDPAVAKVLVKATMQGNTAEVERLPKLEADLNLSGGSFAGGSNTLISPVAAGVNSGQVSLDEVHPFLAPFVWSRGKRIGSPLLYAISQEASIEDIAKLLSQGSPADPPEDKQVTPLGAAAKFGNLEAVKLLVAHHADVNAGGPINTRFPELTRMSPLWLAAGEGQDEVVEYLLQQGAKPEPAALWQAVYNGSPYPNQRSKDHFEKTVRILIDAGALKTAKPEMAGAILEASLGTRMGSPNGTVLKMLLDAGLSPDLPLGYSVVARSKPNSVINYYRDYYNKNKDDPVFGDRVLELKPLLDMLEAADKGSTPRAGAEAGFMR